LFANFLKRKLAFIFKLFSKERAKVKLHRLFVLGALLLSLLTLSLPCSASIIGISVPEGSQETGGPWSVSVPPYPLSTEGIGQIITPGLGFALHMHVYIDDYVPDPSLAVVTYLFDVPTIVTGLEIIQHANGITRIEGYYGNSLDSLTSLGSVFGSCGDITGYAVMTEGQSDSFDFGNTTYAGTYFQFVVRKTPEAGGFANYNAYPLDVDGNHILGATVPVPLPPAALLLGSGLLGLLGLNRLSRSQTKRRGPGAGSKQAGLWLGALVLLAGLTLPAAGVQAASIYFDIANAPDSAAYTGQGVTYVNDAQSYVTASNLQAVNVNTGQADETAGPGDFLASWWGGSGYMGFSITAQQSINLSSLHYSFFSGNWSYMAGARTLSVQASKDNFVTDINTVRYVPWLIDTSPYTSDCPNDFVDDLSTLGQLNAGQTLSLRFYAGNADYPFIPNGFWNKSPNDYNLTLDFTPAPAPASLLLLGSGLLGMLGWRRFWRG
jgi:hypothetical protein